MSLLTNSVKCDEKTNEQQHKSAWFQFIKTIATFKGDLTSLTAPPFLLAPQSIIEFSAYWAERPSLFVAPANETTPEKRALKVLQWYLSTLREQHATKEDDGKRKKLKPLNPFLGEIFLGKWVDSVGTTEMVSEQVSHHPPATAYKIWNNEHGVRLEGQIVPKAYFSTTVNIEKRGYGVLHLDKHDESYIVQLPKVHVEGIMTLQIAPELSGTYYIPSSSGYTSRIDFSSKGWLRGKSNSFVATVFRNGNEKQPLYVLEGQWSSTYTVKDGQGKLLETMDISAHIRTPLRVAPLERQHPLESRRAWQHVANAINANDVFAVGHEKSKIENAQRALRKQERAASIVWERRYFSETNHDPVAERLRIKDKSKTSEDDYRIIWKFDDAKFMRTVENKLNDIKSPTHIRFDSGVGLTDLED